MAPGSPGHGYERLVGNKKQVDPMELPALPREDWETPGHGAGGREPLLNTEGVGEVSVLDFRSRLQPSSLTHFQEALPSGLPVNQHSEATVGESAPTRGTAISLYCPSAK